MTTSTTKSEKNVRYLTIKNEHLDADFAGAEDMSACKRTFYIIDDNFDVNTINPSREGYVKIDESSFEDLNRDSHWFENSSITDIKLLTGLTMRGGDQPRYDRIVFSCSDDIKDKITYWLGRTCPDFAKLI